MDFTSVLRAFMERALHTNTDLARLSGIPLSTLEHWTAGRVRRPRFVSDVLKLARALMLDELDTTTLLLAAKHPPLSVLQAQVQESSDRELAALLRFWERGDARPAPLPSTTPAPAARYQLRPPVADFVGRDVEQEHLITSLQSRLAEGRGAVISGVQGMGGIGKTELAYAVAHHLRDTFPDGQIVLSLHGSSLSPLTTEQALQTVIRAFTAEATLPEELSALEALYRSVLHHKHVLVLADDAADAAQVRALLPPAGSALLVTSRTRFSLPGMTTINLELLNAGEAVSLLRSLCAWLDDGEATALAQACGYLPLALRISGSILCNNPVLDIATYLGKLTDERQRLTHLHDPDDAQMDVAASLALSYAQLDDAAQQVFRQLGVLIADFDSGLAQATIEAPMGVDIAAMLGQLLRRNLVMYDARRRRWRLHDLIRALARSRLEAAGEAEAAQWRYARAAVAIAKEIQEQYQYEGEKAVLALSRFDVERAHIDAARHWARLHAGTPAGDRLLLEAALATGSFQHMRYDQRCESIPLWEGVRIAAQRLGDRHSEGHALRNLGTAYGRLGDILTTISYFKQARVLSHELGDRNGEGAALNNLGLAYDHLGESSKAIAFYEQALDLSREIGDRSGEGRAFGNLGLVYTRLGELPKAIICYEQHLAISREIGYRLGEGIALTNLGNIYTEQGDTSRANACCEAALTIARAIGDRQAEGYALSYLALTQARQGDMAWASSTYVQARARLQEVSDRWGEAECNWLFGLALAQQGQREAALPLLRSALAYEQEIGHAKAAEHAALIALLEAGEELPPHQRAVGRDKDTVRPFQSGG